MGRWALVPVLLASFLVACGSDDDGDAASNAATDDASDDASNEDDSGSDSGGAEPASDSGDIDLGEHGGVSFEITGGHEVSGDFVFIPAASVYDGGGWSMSFTTPSEDGSAVLALNLIPDVMNVTYGDGEFTTSGGPSECTFDVDHQDADGATGSFDCKGLTGFTSTGAVTDVSFHGVFDARR